MLYMAMVTSLPLSGTVTENGTGALLRVEQRFVFGELEESAVPCVDPRTREEPLPIMKARLPGFGYCSASLQRCH